MKTLEITKVERRERKREFGQSWREFEAKPRIYVFLSTKGRNQVEALLFDRYSTKDLIANLRREGTLDEILDQAGIARDTKLVFSQKAGCSCRCSPGLIVQSTTFPPYDVFVDIVPAVAP